MLRHLALAGALALSACSVPPSGGAMDPGGNIGERAAQIARMEATGDPFVAPRMCLSACTMYLALSTACFPRDGTLGFHSARNPVLPGLSDRAGNLFLAGFYAKASPRLARWFLDGPARSDAMVMVPAAELIERGEARAC